jgi:hypothetical protein
MTNMVGQLQEKNESTLELFLPAFASNQTTLLQINHFFIFENLFDYENEDERMFVRSK